ncbi:CDP-diacylglycerol--glycerol-3-phosphate 3-phosphatidyltransferase, mitochondrial isoform X2 [Parasteatoda tepidariorum]|nr:CDP-diacylglycerol--glycerol-3-phosphate 3-phosphatidyltransferase, mitochondrial isoform X2 [Parasteatoda tepidariorum]XP_015912989.2 CDP-diacylglycerol--glycerol-3-phosphate 3-phosphatidyltransferase, mitochondrial isoform X2 [Parasteatoda tepidariorum]XP_015912990.2 CDP-diacylglycerol--glycerol-3-phosphate 3-phosphatidyltransferase, mitochondrial isoform X2 [Parasteatoda tepidariorum]
MKECSHHLAWLSDYSPEFSVSSRNIQILQEPSDFFEKLKDLSRTATKRITLASLYIGNGALEKELISSINEGLQNSNGGLQVKILLDYTRGSRGKENSRTLLLPLLNHYPSQFNVSLYHTPKLRGLIKWILPDRWNETIGLSHLKVYLFDDTLILSGANLSDQYFSNRQDRYVVFNDCKELCDYFDDLVSTISSMSFLLKPDNSVILHSDWNIHPSEGSFKEFVTKANKYLQKFICPVKNRSIHLNNCMEHGSKKSDTLVYPLLQMHTFNIRQDEQVVEKFLRLAEPNSCIKLASGYFNLTNHYMSIILKSSKALYSLLVASPKVNGFYGASGVSGAIPMAYTHIAKTFFSKVLNYRQQNRIELREYERSDWTFHVKGLWYYKPDETLPSVTFIGSPNFGYRSVYKDLEAQVAIVTSSKDLQLQLHNEQQRLYDRTTVIDKSLFDRPDRKVSLWVKLVTFFIRDFF